MTGAIAVGGDLPHPMWLTSAGSAQVSNLAAQEPPRLPPVNSVSAAGSYLGFLSKVGFVTMSESTLNRIEAKIDGLSASVGDLRVAVTAANGRIDSIERSMATKTWILTGIIGTLLGVGALLLGSIAWLVQQYLSPLLQAAGKH